MCAPVDVVLEPGRALGVVGADGAGRSTLLQTLAGLLGPRSGTVAFAGREVAAGALRLVARSRSRYG